VKPSGGVLVAGAAATVLAPFALIIGLVTALGGGPTPAAASPLPLDPNAPIPDEYRPLVEAASTECAQLSAPLLAAQIDAESGWEPTASSPVGAQGLTQFMPDTWATWGRDADGNGRVSVFDPADAIDAQARYMCQLFRDVKHIPGDPTTLALAAYNAGPGAVQMYHGIPPYEETEGYVATITDEIENFQADHTLGQIALPVPVDSGFDTNHNFGSCGAMWEDCHTGEDLSVACGTPVYAATNGTVRIRTDESWSGPWLVQVYAGDGTVTWYAHMQQVNVEPGQAVAAGTVLGEAGTEGNSTGCHLHFEVRPDNAEPIDPIGWLNNGGYKL
jgi:murein DD-endopeptidase MepM/ murein hydrolase activator NlpD